MLPFLLVSLRYELAFINIPKLPGRMSIATYFIQLPKTLEKLYTGWNKLFKITKHAVTNTNM